MSGRPSRTSAGYPESIENVVASQEWLCAPEGYTPRKVREAMVAPAFGQWLAQASILIANDEPRMRKFLVQILGPRCKPTEETAETKRTYRTSIAKSLTII